MLLSLRVLRRGVAYLNENISWLRWERITEITALLPHDQQIYTASCLSSASGWPLCYLIHLELSYLLPHSPWGLIFIHVELGSGSLIHQVLGFLIRIHLL